jgi:hypothetical protein
VVATEDENMMLSESYNCDSMEFEMPDMVTAIEEVSQLMDVQQGDRINDACLVQLRTLVYIDTVVTRSTSPTETVSLAAFSESCKGGCVNGK